MNFKLALLIAAVVLFILAALFFFGLGAVTILTATGLAIVGLACWAASQLPIP